MAYPCNSQCYVNVCATYVAPNEVVAYTDFPAGVGYKIYDQTLDSLTASVNDERARRLMGAYTFRDIKGTDGGLVLPDPDGVIYGQDAGGATIQQLKDAINEIRVNAISFSIIDGNPITYSQINTIKTVIDGLRAECICNTDCGGNTVCACYGYCARCSY